MSRFCHALVRVSSCLTLCCLVVSCAGAKSSFDWGKVKKVSLYAFLDTPVPDDSNYRIYLSKEVGEVYSHQLSDVVRKCLQEKGYEVDCRGDYSVTDGHGLFNPFVPVHSPHYVYGNPSGSKNYARNIAPLVASAPPATDAQAILVIGYRFSNNGRRGTVSVSAEKDTVASFEIMYFVTDPAGGKIVLRRDPELGHCRKFKSFGPSTVRPEDRYNQWRTATAPAYFTDTIESFFRDAAKETFRFIPKAPGAQKPPPKQHREP
ncbi:MAG: hypothetical protein Q7T82_21665 [Armatimonadota bacterium]|nr:hypothetical protein [Armatimonadota bacterium]